MYRSPPGGRAYHGELSGGGLYRESAVRCGLLRSRGTWPNSTCTTRTAVRWDLDVTFHPNGKLIFVTHNRDPDVYLNRP